ncbi:MAG: tRNA (adenosine(37)-N6)-threonylcarbamoyltransferase complex dimerization subunit type 1 TsaB [Proteobacteria bacterium]|nr:tRNA (adenosine(37)-N6)-threonylcarbamoyltransferase complex dimerization subunit type 1 TsaB [Pseudomonadota bacterium]
MGLTLSFETSCGACSVALSDDKEVLVYMIEEAKHRQSELLVQMIEDALAGAGAHYNDVDLIMLTNGPGSFTGIRIGLATAYGMHIALGLKIGAISTLTAMAQGFVEEKPAVVALDAGRHQYYVQEFAANGEALSELQLWEEAQLHGYKGCIAGNFLLPGREVVQLFPDARQVAMYTLRHDVDSGGLPQPLYVREHDAVRRS